MTRHRAAYACVEMKLEKGVVLAVSRRRPALTCAIVDGGGERFNCRVLEELGSLPAAMPGQDAKPAFTTRFSSDDGRACPRCADPLLVDPRRRVAHSFEADDPEDLVTDAAEPGPIDHGQVQPSVRPWLEGHRAQAR